MAGAKHTKGRRSFAQYLWRLNQTPVQGDHTPNLKPPENYEVGAAWLREEKGLAELRTDDMFIS